MNEKYIVPCDILRIYIIHHSWGRQYITVISNEWFKILLKSAITIVTITRHNVNLGSFWIQITALSKTRFWI